MSELDRRRRSRRHTRHDDAYFRSLIGFAIKADLAAQAIRDNRVDDVQAETGAAQIAPRRKERIEGFVPDVGAHATTIVREANFDILITRGSHLDADGAFPPIRKAMRHRIENEIAQHLSIRTGIAVHRQIRRAVEEEGQASISETRPQTLDRLRGGIAQIEDTSI